MRAMDSNKADECQLGNLFCPKPIGPVQVYEFEIDQDPEVSTQLKEYRGDIANIVTQISMQLDDGFGANDWPFTFVQGGLESHQFRIEHDTGKELPTYIPKDNVPNFLCTLMHGLCQGLMIKHMKE